MESEEVRQNLKGIVVKKCIDDMYFFCREVLDFNLMMVEPHRRWCDDLQKVILQNKKRIMRLKPRKTFKTTIYGIGFVLWAWGCISPEIRFFYTSSSKKLIDEVSDSIQQFVGTEKNDTFYSYLFGITKDPEAKNTTDVINIHGRAGKGFSLTFGTSGGSTMGIHPNVIMIDDACLIGKTKVLTKNGYKFIKDIKIGEYVLTREGYKKVLWSGMTQKNAIVEEFDINGNKIVATPNHKIITQNDKKELWDLNKNDKIIKYEDKKWKLEKLEIRKLSNLMELNTEDTQNLKNEHIKNTFSLVGINLKKLGSCIVQFGYFITAQFLKAIIYIIRTIIGILMKSGILNVKKVDSIIQNIRKNYLKIQNIEKSKKNILQKLEKKLLNGANLMKLKNCTEKNIVIKELLKNIVSIVKKNLKFLLYRKHGQNFVVKNVDKNGNIKIKHILKNDIALSADQNLKWKNLKKPFVAPENVLQNIELMKRENVYNLHVKDYHEFVANGILVSNCGEKDLKFQSEREAKEIWFNTLQPLLVPYKDLKTGIKLETIFYIGTHWHLRDLIWYIQEKFIKEKKQEWSVESESITKDATENGPPSYPDFYPREKIDDDISSMETEFFSAQMLNNPIAKGMLTFDLDRLHFIRPEQFEAIRPFGKIICAFDPALGKASGDYPAVIYLHQWKDTITFFDAIDEKLELSVLLPRVAAKNKQLGCRTLVYETNNAMLIEDNLKKVHKKIDHKILLEPVHHGSGSNKEERIKSMQPELYSGAVQFMDDYKTRYPEAMNQIAFYGVYDHDDYPDALEMGISYFKEEQFQFKRFEGLL